MHEDNFSKTLDEIKSIFEESDIFNSDIDEIELFDDFIDLIKKCGADYNFSEENVNNLLQKMAEKYSNFIIINENSGGDE
jgi:hypothetical protein